MTKTLLIIFSLLLSLGLKSEEKKEKPLSRIQKAKMALEKRLEDEEKKKKEKPLRGESPDDEEDEESEEAEYEDDEENDE